jgi:hypothetical protein
MKAVFNFIKTAAKTTGHYLILPFKAYILLAAKSYENLYDKGYKGPMWL